MSLVGQEVVWTNRLGESIVVKCVSDVMTAKVKNRNSENIEEVQYIVIRYTQRYQSGENLLIVRLEKIKLIPPPKVLDWE